MNWHHEPEPLDGIVFLDHATEVVFFKEDYNHFQRETCTEIMKIYALLVEGVPDKSKLEKKMLINNELLINLHHLHTTELSAMRIKRNLSLDTDDVVGWCKMKTSSPNAVIKRNGKNWYVTIDGCIITINAFSFTIITAHREKK